ncbi:glutathione S-transferase [Parasulfitobacter algicola]|uniref:Glutathione S-transferase n=1 Tax=Parasulfitobacter algicola TaxID=2614809 RepID=A0ABX2IZL8_9RHOB|nr:glutathione S-transferase [Sulfitobacter algicola]NSX56199.1 glutathione S-transferase [Sulfitobacter algicola]
MTYDLALGDRAYSSWSLRGWLLFEKFGLPYRTHFARFYTDEFTDLMAKFEPAKTVPTMRAPDGVVVSDSLAIAEELATRHPDAGFWPTDPTARAVARGLAAEMHAGFFALRNDCPMNLRVAYANFAPSDAVQADLRRLETIWAHAIDICKSDGPWLCGAYSVADAFFAPVAARIAGYGLSVNKMAQHYVDAHLSEPAFRKWREASLNDGPDQPKYAMNYDTRPWPGI